VVSVSEQSGVGAAVVWQPPPHALRSSTMGRFATFAGARAGSELDAYHDLHRWSVEDVGRFWGTLAEFYALPFAAAAEPLGDAAMPGAAWFAGAELSYLRQVFRDRPPEGDAVVSAGEDGRLKTLSWGALERRVARVSRALADVGVGPGDHVVGYVTNGPDAIVCFLATASLGAVWSSCSPDFGVRAVVDRFGQLEPRVLVAVDGYRYGGRTFDRRDVVEQLRDALPSLRATLVVPLLGVGAAPDDDDAVTTLPAAEAAVPADVPLRIVDVPFAHPLWVLYSSGTTGLPKALVHSHGGILLEHLKWLGLHTGLRAGDRLFWMTTTGWTMWNFLVGGLLVGATVVTFDGDPMHPEPDALWDLAERAGVTCLGAGATYFQACMKRGVRPRDGRRLAALRAVGSTGSPLAPEAYDWIYAQLDSATWLFSTSGGTDVCTAFVGGVPLLPVRRGELQAPALGVDLRCFGVDGEEVAEGVGELVVAQPMPSMPVALVGDADGRRYHDAYFATFPGVWRHGDWIERTPSGGAVIHGRSDATINRGGIRIGTAEIYRVILDDDAVQDAVAADVPVAGATGASRLLLFVALSHGQSLTGELEQRLRGRIRDDCSRRHVPDRVVAAPAIPRTLSGKVLEVPVKRVLAGAAPDEVADPDSLAQPEALAWFAAWRDAEGVL
jgi:acetoacetyl-CoA synthetase